MEANPDQREIQSAIRDKYRKVAHSAEGMFKYATGTQGTRALGYDSKVIADAPSRLLRSFCGVGNPFALGAIRRGKTVLDVGCGAGFDLYVASRKVGDAGRVLGVDLTPDMVSVATDNIARSGLMNVEVRQGSSEALPYERESIDVVISNGVFNLSPRKRLSFEEVFRVTKPGGRLQFADIVLNDDLPGDVVGSLEAWSN